LYFCPLSRNIDLLNIIATGIDRSKVHFNNRFPFHPVRFYDRLFHVVLSQFIGDHIGNPEECRLHNGIGPVTQAKIHRELCPVDDVEIDLIFGKVFLHVIRESEFNLILFPDRIK